MSLSRPPLPDRAPAGFGAKLRDARERRGMSLRQIANATKISIAALEALERDEVSRLPGGIFSRAFVRSYAVEVGLDPEAAIQDFIAQFPNDSVTAGHPTSDQVEDHQAVESEQRTAGTFLWLAVVSLPLAAAVFYFATAGRPLMRGENGPGAAAPANPVDAPSVHDAPPSNREPLARPPGAVPPAAAPSPEAPPASGPSPRPVVPASTAAEDTNHFSVQLSVTRPCWVSATVDGRKHLERLLKPGERTTVDVRREMVLTVGDAAALAMTINGEGARAIGKAGEVVTARLNLSNFKTYLQTR
jgi:cytoskeleton protein RodZ